MSELRTIECSVFFTNPPRFIIWNGTYYYNYIKHIRAIIIIMTNTLYGLDFCSKMFGLYQNEKIKRSAYRDTFVVFRNICSKSTSFKNVMRRIRPGFDYLIGSIDADTSTSSGVR